MKIKSNYRNSFIEYYWIDDVLIANWKIEHATYDFVDFCIKKRIEITNGDPFVMISIISSLKSNSKEARRRMSEIDAQADCIAVGVITHSKTSALISQLFSNLYNTKSYTKFFTESEMPQALEWCKKKKDEYLNLNS